MKSPSLRSTWWLAVVGCGALVAAAHAGGQGPAAPAGPVEAKASGKSAAAVRWTPLAMAKHNGSGVRVAYAVPVALQPGRTGSVQLQFSGVGADDARVEWRGPQGSLVSSALLGAASSMALPAGQVTTLVLDVTPAADGMAYLDVFTSQGGRTSAQSVPLKVGSGAVHLKRDGNAQTMPSGEQVISLPSQPK